MTRIIHIILTIIVLNCAFKGTQSSLSSWLHPIDKLKETANKTLEWGGEMKGKVDDFEDNLKSEILETGKNVGDGIKETSKAVGTGVEKTVGGIKNAGETVMNFGGKLADLIKETITKIPEILTSGLWVYGDDGKLERVTLEIPPLLEFSADVRDDVFFSLHTRNNSDGVPLYVDDAEYLKTTDFNVSRETVIVAHGWKNSNKSLVCQLMKEAFLKHGEYNVILVDWGKIAKKMYIYAANMVTPVGKYVANLIDFLELEGADPQTIRLVGHSLGAHVVGLGGYYARSKVLYIHGCDPALPLFFTSTPKERISTESAKSVEIIHSNAGLLGVALPFGHADFYPNGGTIQPGCSGLSSIPCDHSRSYIYLAESFNDDVQFLGNRCESQRQLMKKECTGPVGVMGTLRDNLPYRGSYYLNTNSNATYAMGDKGLLLVIGDDAENNTESTTSEAQ